MASDCIFCKIVDGEIDAEVAYRSETAVAFHDLNPQAPVHVLVVPTVHAPGIVQLPADIATPMLSEVAHVIGLVAKPTGHRLVVNSGDHAGQSVDHLHFHILSGRPMTWPPG